MGPIVTRQQAGDLLAIRCTPGLFLMCLIGELCTRLGQLYFRGTLGQAFACRCWPVLGLRPLGDHLPRPCGRAVASGTCSGSWTWRGSCSSSSSAPWARSRACVASDALLFTLLPLPGLAGEVAAVRTAMVAQFSFADRFSLLQALGEPQLGQAAEAGHRWAPLSSGCGRGIGLVIC